MEYAFGILALLIVAASLAYVTHTKSVLITAVIGVALVASLSILYGSRFDVSFEQDDGTQKGNIQINPNKGVLFP